MSSPSGSVFGSGLRVLFEVEFAVVVHCESHWQICWGSDD